MGHDRLLFRCQRRQPGICHIPWHQQFMPTASASGPGQELVKALGRTLKIGSNDPTSEKCHSVLIFFA